MKGSGKWLAAVAVLMLVLAGTILAADAEDKDKAKKKAEAAARRRTMLAAARSGFCRVHYYFKRPEDEKVEREWQGYDYSRVGREQYRGMISRQMSLLTVGVLLDDAGHVLVGDRHVDARYIDRIEVVGPDGTRYPAVRDRLLERTLGVILRITKPLKEWKAPAFVEQAAIDEEDEDSAFIATMMQDGPGWFISLAPAPVGGGYTYEGGGAPGAERSSGGIFGGNQLLGESSFGIMSFAMLMRDQAGRCMAPALVCDAQGRPIGVTSAFGGASIDARQEKTDWQHRRLLEGPALTFARLAELETGCRAEFGRKVAKCKIMYRQKGQKRDRFGGPSMYGMPGRNQKEWTTFGLAVSPERLLVPEPITPDQAAKIEKIELTVDGKTLEARFTGAFEEIGAFVVEVKDGTLPAFAALTQDKRPERGHLFLTLEIKEKFGKKHFTMKANRWRVENRGYKDRYYISPMFPVSRGAWILSRDLEVLGVQGRQRIEGEGVRAAAQGRMSSAMMMGAGFGNDRIFWASEVAPMVADPVAHFDPRIRSRTEDEAKRLVWLGVECDPLTHALAKQLKVEKESKDGTVGLLVSRIYPGSPAERIGIREGDILLKLKTRKQPFPIDLSPAAFGRRDFGSDFDWTQYADYRNVEEYGQSKPRWPMRLNYLTMLLKMVGEGEEVQLTYLHDGTEVTGPFTIEQAPRDFISAGKYKNREVGLTVKDLTYEVRAALRLAAEKQAVVVSKIEPGSPAQVARVRPFELIAAIDGEPVASAEAFGKRIKQALAAGKKSVRLTLELLEKTRLADLDLTRVKAKAEE